MPITYTHTQNVKVKKEKKWKNNNIDDNSNNDDDDDRNGQNFEEEFNNIKYPHKCEINSFREKADCRLFSL